MPTTTTSGLNVLREEGTGKRGCSLEPSISGAAKHEGMIRGLQMMPSADMIDAAGLGGQNCSAQKGQHR